MNPKLLLIKKKLIIQASKSFLNEPITNKNKDEYNDNINNNVKKKKNQKDLKELGAIIFFLDRTGHNQHMIHACGIMHDKVLK